MKKEDLKELLSQAIRGIMLNKEAATPEMISLVRQVTGGLSGEEVTDPTIQKVVESASKFLAIEEMLITDKMGDKLIEALHALIENEFVLGLIAKALK